MVGVLQSFFKGGSGFPELLARVILGEGPAGRGVLVSARDAF